MAAITVAEMRDALPPGSALLGGAAGLGRPVTGTAAFRARTPAFPALHGGEIAIVPLPLLRQVDPHAPLDRLVGQLAEAGIAAILLLGAEHDPLAARGTRTDDPSATLAGASGAADSHGVPVFAVPPGPTPEEVDLSLHRHLAGQREALLRRSQELQHEFTQLALAGRGLGTIVERLAAVTGLGAAWEVPPGLEPIAWAPPPAGWDPPPELARGGADALLKAARLPLQRWIASRPAGGAATDVTALPLRADGAGDASSWRRLVITVRAEADAVAGYLSLVGPEHGAVARLALSAAALAASIESLRARTASQAQGSAVSALIHDWLAGRPGPGEIAARAGQIGLALAPPFAVVVVESDPLLAEHELVALAPALDPSPPPGRRDSPATSAVATSAPIRSSALATGLGQGRAALIVPIGDESALESAAARLHAALAHRAGSAGVSAAFAGIGRAATSVGDVPRAYGEALQALAVARRLGGRHRVAYFGTLGVYRVLASTSPEELAAFRRDALAPLLHSGDRAASDLLRTLETYLLCGGSPQETAQRLHTHRNTILYRMQKIAEALGVDIRAPETQFTLWLALRAGDVLDDARLPSADGAAHAPEAVKAVA